MSRLETNVSEDLAEDCKASMMPDNMGQGRLLAYAQQVEESRRKRKIQEGKKPKAVDQPSSSSGRGSFGVQYKPKFKRNSGNSATSGNL